MLQRLGEVDGALITSKPVGGLPETAKEQLDKFMVRVKKSYLTRLYIMLAFNSDVLSRAGFLSDLNSLLTTEWDPVVPEHKICGSRKNFARV